MTLLLYISCCRLRRLGLQVAPLAAQVRHVTKGPVRPAESVEVPRGGHQAVGLHVRVKLLSPTMHFPVPKIGVVESVRLPNATNIQRTRSTPSWNYM